MDRLTEKADRSPFRSPAGYLVASIRSDYRPPSDVPAAGAPPPGAAEARRAAEEAEHQVRRRCRNEVERASAREAGLRARWVGLDESVWRAIQERVEAANPGLRRWKAMLEPLCLAELERQLGPDAATPVASQGALFDPGPGA